MSERLFEDFPPISPETWLAQVEKDLKNTPMSRLEWENESGIALSAFYQAKDLPAGIAEELPADGINRRGNSPWMYAEKPWEICVELPVGNPALAAQVLSGLEHAPDAIRFVLPENQRHAWEMSKEGLPGPQITADWKDLVTICLQKGIAMHLDAGQSALGSFAGYADALQKAGIDLKSVKGSGATSALSSLGIQPVADLVVKWMMTDATALVSYSTKQLPGFRAIVIDLEPHVLQGANGAQELALALGMAVEYAAQLQDAGFSAQEVFATTAFRFPVSTDFFAEIARFRAFRMVWARVLQAYGLDSKDSSFTQIMATGSRRQLAGLDAPTNILRATTEAMSAVLGGAASVSVPSFDELSGHPNDLSMRLSANLQRVLRHESYLDFVVDPSAGSYYVEKLTDRFAEKAWAEFQEIEAAGGYLAYLQQGKLAEKLNAQAEKRVANINKGKVFVLGVNQYPDLSRGVDGMSATVNSGIFGPSSALKDAVNAPVADRVERVRECLKTNSIPQVAEAQLMRHPEGIVAANERRDAEGFEQLRTMASRISPKPAYLFIFGDQAMRQARANFAMNLLGAGGVSTITNPHPDDLEAALSDCIWNSPDVVVLCAADADYFAFAPEILAELKKELPHTKMILAGKPQGWESFQSHGLHTCVFVGMDRFEWLSGLLHSLKTTQHHAS